MADLLRFKKGSFANLEKQTKVPGTIYVTTDEKAMYVDISNSERIRLGDIIQYDTYTDFQKSKPPYNEKAIYYIVDENALLKYLGVKDGAHKWQQINSVSDVQADINALEGVVGELSQNLTTLNTQVNGNGSTDTGLVGRIVTLENDLNTATTGVKARLTAVEGVASANKTAIGTALEGQSGKTIYQLIDNAQDAADAAAGIANGNSNSISALAQRVTAVEGVNNTQNTTLEGLRSDLGQPNANAGTGSAFARIKQLETNGSNHADRIEDLESDLQGLTSTVNGHTTSIGKNAEDIAKNASDITTLTTRVTTAEGDIDKLEAWKTTASGQISTLQSDMSTAKSNISSLQGDVGTLTTDLGTLNGKVTTNTNNISTNTADITTIKGQITDINAAANTLKGRVDGHDTKIATIEGNITGLTSTVNGHTTAISNLDANKVDKTTYATDKAALEKKIDDDIRAANALEYKGTVSKKADLPTSQVKIGYTYVASSDFEVVTGTKALAGDLLVAKGSEGTDGYITGTITWDVVSTGYIQAHENKIVSSGNALKLQSYTGVDLSQFEFKAEGAAKVTVAKVDNNPVNNTVTVSIEWEDFN